MTTYAQALSLKRRIELLAIAPEPVIVTGVEREPAKTDRGSQDYEIVCGEAVILVEQMLADLEAKASFEAKVKTLTGSLLVPDYEVEATLMRFQTMRRAAESSYRRWWEAGRNEATK